VGGSLAPCLIVRFGRICAPTYVGALIGTGFGFSNAKSDVSTYVAVGLRGGLDVQLGVLIVRPFASFNVPLTRTTLGFGDVDLWTTPAVSASGGLALLIRP